MEIMTMLIDTKPRKSITNMRNKQENHYKEPLRSYTSYERIDDANQRARRYANHYKELMQETNALQQDHQYELDELTAKLRKLNTVKRMTQEKLSKTRAELESTKNKLDEY